MNAVKFRIQFGFVAALLAVVFCSAAIPAFAQRQYTVEKAATRAANERVKAKTVARTAPSKGLLIVLLNPKVAGKVTVKNAKGQILTEGEADDTGQAEFQLARGQIYTVEASAPRFSNATNTSRPLASQTAVRVDLTAQTASLKLRGLPLNAQIFIDETLRATVSDKEANGVLEVENVSPGDHKILIRHPEYNDYTDRLEKLEAGVAVTFGRISLVRVAKLNIQGPADARVMIDGAVLGRINANGSVQIDYELEKATEHTISVELLGYQPWAQKVTLEPGPRTIAVKLDPVVTAAGLSDLFDSLVQWNAPSSWKITGDAKNKLLEVKGPQLGWLKDVTYRDFKANFTITLPDGKGASWAVRADKEGRNYYLFHLSGPNSTTHTPKRFYTYLVKDGGTPQEVSTPIPLVADLDTKSSYTITVTVRDYTIKHTITSNSSGQEDDLGIWTDTSNTKDKFLFGTFGFRAFSNEVFLVDELHLCIGECLDNK